MVEDFFKDVRAKILAKAASLKARCLNRILRPNSVRATGYYLFEVDTSPQVFQLPVAVTVLLDGINLCL